MKGWFYLFLLFTFIGPIGLILSGTIHFTDDYRTANRDSANLAPNPQTTPEAVIQVYSARTFGWRGLFAAHTWLAVKPKDAPHYTVYQVIGWRMMRQLPPLMVAKDLPDRNWFNHQPDIILDVRGKAAEDIIPKIDAVVADYPYANTYLNWPGPNSNTFIAYIGRQIPELGLVMPGNAIGKDYIANTVFFAPTPSGTGYQLTLLGLLGVTVASKEGLEINILGLVYGFSWATKTIKLPGFGDIQFWDR